MTKRCPRCERDLPVTAYHPDYHQASGCASRCKRCVSELRRQRYATDPQWRQKQIERVRARRTM